MNERPPKTWLPGRIRFIRVWITMIMAILPLDVVPARELVVGTNPGFVPFEFMDIRTTKIVGFDIDLLHEVARYAAFDYRIKNLDFSGIIPALQAGAIDIAISGVSITPARSKVVDFSEPYYTAELSIMVHSSQKGITRIEDLEGKKVGTQLGTTSYDFLRSRMKNARNIIPYPDQSQMFMALMSRTIDAAFLDRPTLEYFALQRSHGKVKVMGPVYRGEQYGIAFPKNSPWVDAVNEALDSMKKDGTYDRIRSKWFDGQH